MGRLMEGWGGWWKTIWAKWSKTAGKLQSRNFWIKTMEIVWDIGRKSQFSGSAGDPSQPIDQSSLELAYQ